MKQWARARATDVSYYKSILISQEQEQEIAFESTLQLFSGKIAIKNKDFLKFLQEISEIIPKLIKNHSKKKLSEKQFCFWRFEIAKNVL